MDAVIVRFKKPPTDEEIETIAKEQGLGEWERNEFVARQIYFQAPDGFSGELLLRIKGYAEVTMAWQDRLVEYRKDWTKPKAVVN